MKKERENIDILHTPSHVPVHARVHASPSAILQHSQSSSAPSQSPCCWHCRLFEPTHPVAHEKPYDETLPGEARPHPPLVGDLIKRGTDAEGRWFGNFPRVMAGDWCGQFQPREVGQ